VSLTSAYARLATDLSGAVRRDEPMARHTSFRIGGPAALFVECDTLGDVAAATAILAEENVEYKVLGKGSNVLVADSGYEGAVLVLGRDFKRHSLEDNHLRTGAGVILAAVVQDAFKAGYTGLEFAVGIPGTVGGALCMNAGSRDEWIGAITESVTVFSPGQGLLGVRGPEVAWGYRRTDLVSKGIIVEAVLKVAPGDAAHIRRTMEASLRRRKRNQPLGLPSAGSVFVNPPDDSAGRLIEASGLKGTTVGGAGISDVHANFIVNLGGATASDVLALVRLARDAVKGTYGVELKPEIRFLGSFEEP
jgi:UDP-N-acetylmuramate dehydrogenase